MYKRMQRGSCALLSVMMVSGTVRAQVDETAPAPAGSAATSDSVASEPAPSPLPLPAPTALAALPQAAPPSPTPPSPPDPPHHVAPPLRTPHDDVTLSTLLYLHGAQGSVGGKDYSRFYIGRAYFTGKFKPVAWFHARVTLDAHQEKLDGENLRYDEGDWSMRLKYAYGQVMAPDLGHVITGSYAELGMVHTPWLDFEEHINRYRMQGTMFMERNGLFNSADLGVTVGGNLGPRLGDDALKKVSKANPGSFGSFAFGVYNGGGYAAHEANENKVVEGRLSARPLGPLFPYAQLSYFGIFGKGNTPAAPAWRLHAGMLSVEREYFVVTGTCAVGRGNQKGSQLSGGDGREFVGYSAFAELKAPWFDASLFGRFDRFEWGKGDGQPSDRVILGVAYWFLKHNAVVADWDWLNEHDAAKADQKELKVTLQVELP